MDLKLSKPIIFFDIEATGLNTTHDRIVELCYIKVMPNGEEKEKTYRFNPTISISEEATSVNGIKNTDVENCHTFKDLAPEIWKDFEGSNLAGFNSNRFDVPMLIEEFLRVGITPDISKVEMIDVQNIYHKLEQRNLIAAYKFYCNKDLTEAHTASADTRATYEVLKAQIDKYPDELKNDVDSLAKFSKHNDNVDLAGRMIFNNDHIEIFNFGKYKGQLVTEVLARDKGYYNWIMRGDFPQNTKQELTRIKLREEFK